MAIARGLDASRPHGEQARATGIGISPNRGGVMPAEPRQPLVPVSFTTLDVERKERPAEGIALCLSGGGYRAMLFHVGALWRLNDLGYLPKLNRVSSVSGGSITAGVLAMNWTALG